MLTESVFFGLVATTFKYGNMRFLRNLRVKFFFMPIAAFLLEMFCEIIIFRDWFGWQAVLNEYYLVVQIIIYTILVIFCYYNLDRKIFILILVGILLNFVVIAFNDGMMPVDVTGALSEGYHAEVEELSKGLVAGHAVLDEESTRLSFLGDVLHIPPPYPFPKTVSLGDIAISLGVFLYLFNTKNWE